MSLICFSYVDEENEIDICGKLCLGSNITFNIVSADHGFALVDPNTGVQKLFSGEEAYDYLFQHWTEVKHYSDERGERWLSIVYDSIWIDMWAADLDKLLQLICELTQFSEAVEEAIIKEVNRELSA